MSMKLHHTAIVTCDVESSLAFYRDGLGMEVTLDIRPEGEFTTLFGAPVDRLHSIFLADPADPTSGIVELVEFEGIDGPPAPVADRPSVGFFLISFYVDFDAVVDRLTALGFPLERQIRIQGRRDQTLRMGVLHDPNGVLVELIELP